MKNKIKYKQILPFYQLGDRSRKCVNDLTGQIGKAVWAELRRNYLIFVRKKNQKLKDE